MAASASASIVFATSSEMDMMDMVWPGNALPISAASTSVSAV